MEKHGSQLFRYFSTTTAKFGILTNGIIYKFDVHSFIFSDDAVGLENKLHTILNDKRVNKVNLRKEFFKIPIDDLEKLVYEIEPTAEFNKTMLAEEYRQSLSGDFSPIITSYDDEDDEAAV